MMRILLTGVTGQVGGALRGPLGALGEVVAAERTLIDLAQPQSMAEGLDRLAPDLIVNPAAYTAVDRAEDEPALAHRINAEAPGAMARWAAKRDVPVIHFSTDYVFDGSGEAPWREDSPTGPLSVYGASKLAGENAVRAAKGAHLIVRTSWVYAGKGKNFLRTAAKLAEERPELRIVSDQFGAPSSANVIASAVAAILGRTDFRRTFSASEGIVNLAASGVTTWHGFATAIVEGLRARGVALAAETIVPIRTADYPTKARRPANSRFDLERLRAVFGIVTPHWRDALAPELDALAAEMRSAR